MAFIEHLLHVGTILGPILHGGFFMLNLHCVVGGECVCVTEGIFLENTASCLLSCFYITGLSLRKGPPWKTQSPLGR